jgi:iron complex transport system ATP-binding protein
MDANRQQSAAVELHNVGVLRGGRWLVRGIDWTIAAGTCAAILGPNGSGKSTLARVIMGHLWPSEGEVAVGGARFGEVDLNELRRSIRLVQSAGPYDAEPELTAREVVLTGAFGTIGLFDAPSDTDRSHASSLLARVGLSDVADHRYATLSSGERVRTLIARALLGQPSLLILDEPTAGLDLLAREQVLATVQALLAHAPPRPTVLMITHHVEELPPQTQSVLLLEQGRAAARGGAGEVLKEDVLSRVYRCPVRVEQHDGRYFLRVAPSAWKDLLG